MVANSVFFFNNETLAILLSLFIRFLTVQFIDKLENEEKCSQKIVL